MQHTRQQIIAYLNNHRIATPIDMSRALQVTAANIRHHLKILKQGGLVEVVGKQPGRGRGRPMMLYSLTESALQNNLGGLASALLQTIQVSSQDHEETLGDVANNLLSKFDPAANIHARLKQAIEKLNQLQYQASWEAAPSGPRLIFRNCPYASILDEHPELCQLDAIMLASMLKQSFRQTAKLERQPDGAPHCVFEAR